MAYRVLLLSVMLTACGPLGPVPGGKLDGELASGPERDWSFTDTYKTVQLETRPDDPYSINVWCVSVGRNLYVGAGQGASSTWARALLDDARARIRIGGTVYRVSTSRVTDPSEITSYLGALSRKYSDADGRLSDFQPGPDQQASAILFRLAPRPGNGAAQQGNEADRP